MAQQEPPPSQPERSPEPVVHIEAKGDPWQAFAYLVSGVLFYGFLGWAADRWLGTNYLVVAGIFVGAGLGIYLTFGRFGVRNDHQQTQHDSRQQD